MIAAEAGLSSARILVRVSGPAVDADRHRPRLLRLARDLRAAATRAPSPRASASTATRPRWPPRSRRCSATAAVADGGSPRSRPAPRGAPARDAAHGERALRPGRGGRPRGGPPGAAAAAHCPRRAGRRATRRSSSAPAPRCPPRSRPATWPSARSARSPTATARTSGRSAIRSRASAGATLFLQDAYVYAVIQNPLGVPDLGAITYKLASTDGHVHGAVTQDGNDAIAGKVGPRPRVDPAARGRAQPGRRGRGARLAACRRAPPRLRRRPVVRRAARRDPGARAPDARLRAGDLPDVRALPREGRRRPLGLLQPVLLGGRRRGGPVRGGLRARLLRPVGRSASSVPR